MCLSRLKLGFRKNLCTHSKAIASLYVLCIERTTPSMPNFFASISYTIHTYIHHPLAIRVEREAAKKEALNAAQRGIHFMPLKGLWRWPTGGNEARSPPCHILKCTLECTARKETLVEQAAASLSAASIPFRQTNKLVLSVTKRREKQSLSIVCMPVSRVYFSSLFVRFSP